MRTFIIRARKASTTSERFQMSIGQKEHVEVIAHVIMNAFFISNGFREAVEVYIILDSSQDFPCTIKLSSGEGLSMTGFSEKAILDFIVDILKHNGNLQKNETLNIAKGITISGFGFEKLVDQLIKNRPLYLLEPKGEDIRNTVIATDPVFILSDHIPLPKNNITTLKRRGLKTISLGKKMLFASQCIVLLNDELDRQF